MRRTILLFLLLMSLLKILYCENFPIVSNPIEIKGNVNFYDNNDFAIYRIYILNPTNLTYEYTILTLSVDWLIFYGKDDKDKFGVILPGHTKEIFVYLRPKKIQVQAPIFIVSFKSNIGDVSYSNNIILNPRIIYNRSDILPVIIYDIEIFPEKIKAGDIFSVVLKINNPNFYDVVLPISLNTSYGYKKESIFILTPGLNSIKIDSVIPSSIRATNITISILVGDKHIEKILDVLIENRLPSIEQKGNYIIISNPYEDYLYYEFELPYSKIDFIFFKLSPRPYDYILRNGNIYARWKLILLPNEKYIIKKQLNYYTILVLFTILALFILFLILILQPKVEIRKEIVRFSPDDKVLRIAIYIKNNSLLSLNNVIIRDRIPEMFKVDKYDTAEPLGLYKDGKETILEWSYDKIRSREEIILSYTLKLSEELPKVVTIPNATLIYNYLFKEKVETSNKISINIIK